MSTRWMQIAAVTAVITIGGPALGVAQSSQAQSDTFTWNGDVSGGRVVASFFR
jgi:hypothetical protein